MRWPLRSQDEGSQAQPTHNSRDKAIHEAYHLEDSRNFSFYDRAVLVITSYGPREMGGGTACGKPMKGGGSRGTAIG